MQKESSSVLLLSATAFVILKQAPKARNNLKRLCKISWNIRIAEDMERGWMLLADMYMQVSATSTHAYIVYTLYLMHASVYQSGKYDLAIELLKRCLKYNKVHAVCIALPLYVIVFILPLVLQQGF